MGVVVRKWQCFVCGIFSDCYEDFKDHIVGAHEAGREYLVCPKCEAPVRDTKMHWKLKHPTLEFPKGIQCRVTVWSDFSATGKKKTRKPKFREGDFISTKMNGKSLHYRSGWECTTYELLEQLPEVVSYSAEPLEIDYFHNGRHRKYRPDIAVHYADGRKELWEIKPKSQTTLEVNRAKWAYAASYCLERGWEFQVLTETGIDRLKKKVTEINRNKL